MFDRKRREFIFAVGGTVALAPFAARAQALPVIGWLHSADAHSFAGQTAAFHRGLNEGGFFEGRNIAIEYRWAEGRNDRLPALAADLVQRKVNLIVTMGGPVSALAAKAATDSIPIVFNSAVDPVRLGLVTNLGRPGGNVTGISLFFGDLVTKQIDLLHQLIPGAAAIAVLVNPKNPESLRRPDEAQEAARKLRIDVKVVNAGTVTEIDQAFESLAATGVNALLVSGDPFFGSRLGQLVGLAARHRIPTMYYRREYVAAGGLMSYGTSIEEAYRQNGLYAAKVLKGARPGDLPVLQASKFNFTINLKTAKSLSLEFHPQLLATVDEVIE